MPAYRQISQNTSTSYKKKKILPEIYNTILCFCSLSDDLLRLIVFVNNVEKYDHCKEGEPGNDACSINILITVIINDWSKSKSCDFRPIEKCALNRIVHL